AFHAFEFDSAEIAPRQELAVRIPDVRDAPRHPGREVATRLAENDDAAAGHVFAAVVADSFNDRLGAAVPHAEPLGSPPTDESLTARRAVEADVADQDVVLRNERRQLRGINHDATAGEPLADVVVRISFDFERYALREERTEALSSRAVELDVDRVVRQQ